MVSGADRRISFLIFLSSEEWIGRTKLPPPILKRCAAFGFGSLDGWIRGSPAPPILQNSIIIKIGRWDCSSDPITKSGEGKERENIVRARHTATTTLHPPLSSLPKPISDLLRVSLNRSSAMNGDGKKRRREKSNSYRDDSRSKSKQNFRLGAEEQLESKLGFSLFTEGDKRLGWLLTFSPVPIPALLNTNWNLF